MDSEKQWMQFHFVILVLVELICVTITEAENYRDKPVCRSNAHVCTSIMKYPDGTEFDEGPYCQCPGCSSAWRKDDFQSLSWPHYEKADRTVQYKFCAPIIPERPCEPGDLAVTMGTAMSEWSPHVREARCACPDSVYQLMGWWRHPAHNADNRTGQWIYEYFCEKPVCTEELSPCAKIYIDRQGHSDDVILGYNFLCACPHGYKCPDRDEDTKYDLQHDARGKYIPRYCQVIHRSFKK